MRDDSENRQQLEKAWTILAGESEVRYFAKRSDGSALGGRVYSKEALCRMGRNLESLGYDVYLHLNPSQGPGLKATSRQVTALHRILIDLDPIEPELDATLALRQVLLTAESLIPGIFLAAHELDTGRGAQAWVQVGPATIDLNKYERATAGFLQKLRAAWDNRYGYRIDSVCYDLGRIARCPGTINTKTQKSARFVGAPPLGYLEAKTLLEFYTAPPKQAIERPENVSNLMALSPHLNGLAREFLHNGVDEGDRHHAAHVAALNLLELGVDFDSVVYWILRGGGRCRPRLSRSDVVHCTSTAMKKLEENGKLL